MIVYHGSNMIVDHPRLVRQNRTLDFGYGFYTTFNKDQAVNFAEKVTARRETGIPCVSMYETNEEWLDFVFANRNGSYEGVNYDIIFGPVANDTIYRTFIAYEEGILTKDETIARLKVKKLYNQMTFTTENSLKELKYTGQLPIGRDCNE